MVAPIAYRQPHDIIVPLPSVQAPPFHVICTASDNNWWRTGNKAGIKHHATNRSLMFAIDNSILNSSSHLQSLQIT